MSDTMEIIRMFAIALLIAVTAVGIPYLVFQLITAPMRRQATIQMVIAQLSATVVQHIPLATGLAIAAQSETRRTRRRLIGMSKLVAKGKKLSDAMRSAFPECPGILISLVVAGERSGQLPAAIQQAEQYVQEKSRLRGGEIESPLPYALAVVTAATFVTSMLAVVIVPKFVEIFSDFGIDGSQCIANVTLSLRVLLTVLAGLLIVLPFSLWAHIKPRKTPIPGSMSRVVDWVRWHTPGLSKMELGRGMASAFGAMKFCISSGMGLHEAVAVASKLDVNWQLRQKLNRLSADLSRGTSAHDATRNARIGGIAATVLASGGRQRNMTAALRFASDYYGSMISRWWLFVSSVTWPICTLLLACLIGFLVYSMFQPLVLLIDATITSTGF
ncbi:MAG: hypothetical protein DHS20C16_31760 [Phycisphaerae bacterium]|nr:MAG: hypothetical protein DHS20C16_31760 [Phycisphaerae bacterium]